jgi:hypothetical protein
MQTRHKFIVTGNIIYNGNKETISFQVRSTTRINRIISILCDTFSKDVSQIKSVCIWCQYMTWSELHHIDYKNYEDTTFRDLSIVGKKSITLTVNLDNFF